MSSGSENGSSKKPSARAKESLKKKHCENESARRARLADKFNQLSATLDTELDDTAGNSRIQLLQAAIDAIRDSRAKIAALEASLAAVLVNAQRSPQPPQTMVGTTATTNHLPTLPALAAVAPMTLPHASLSVNALGGLAVVPNSAASVSTTPAVSAAPQPRKRSHADEAALPITIMNRVASGNSLVTSVAEVAISSNVDVAKKRRICESSCSSGSSSPCSHNRHAFVPIAVPNNITPSPPPAIVPSQPPMTPTIHNLASMPLLSQQACFTFTIDGQLLDCTPVFLEKLGGPARGMTRSHALEQSLFSLLHPSELKPTLESLKACLMSTSASSKHHQRTASSSSVNSMTTAALHQPIQGDELAGIDDSRKVFMYGTAGGNSQPTVALRLILLNIMTRPSSVAAASAAATPDTQKVLGIVVPWFDAPTGGAAGPVCAPRGFTLGSAACIDAIDHECCGYLRAEQQRYLVAALYGLPKSKLNPQAPANGTASPHVGMRTSVSHQNLSSLASGSFTPASTSTPHSRVIPHVNELNPSTRTNPHPHAPASSAVAAASMMDCVEMEQSAAAGSSLQRFSYPQPVSQAPAEAGMELELQLVASPVAAEVIDATSALLSPGAGTNEGVVDEMADDESCSCSDHSEIEQQHQTEPIDEQAGEAPAAVVSTPFPPFTPTNMAAGLTPCSPFPLFMQRRDSTASASMPLTATPSDKDAQAFV